MTYYLQIEAVFQVKIKTNLEVIIINYIFDWKDEKFIILAKKSNSFEGGLKKSLMICFIQDDDRNKCEISMFPMRLTST